MIEKSLLGEQSLGRVMEKRRCRTSHPCKDQEMPKGSNKCQSSGLTGAGGGRMSGAARMGRHYLEGRHFPGVHIKCAMETVGNTGTFLGPTNAEIGRFG